MTKLERAHAAFDKQIAVMKKDEEARGQWCICGHSLPTHDVGYTCQSTACNCLVFKPSNATQEQQPQRPQPCGLLHHNDECRHAQEQQPTPRPWRATNIGGSFSIDAVEADYVGIAFVNPMGIHEAIGSPLDKANAALIVRAVNAHDKLVEALREAQLALMNLRTFAKQDAAYIANPDAAGSARSIIEWPWLDGWFDRTREALEAAR